MNLPAVLLAALLALPAAGQTNLPPAAPPTPPAASQAALGANWMAVPFLTYSTGSAQHVGGGLAIISEITPTVATGLRLDYLDGSVWMPSMSLQLQTHVPIGRLTLVPFAFSGAATPLSGSSAGAAVGIVGAGLAVRVAEWHGVGLDVVADLEHWTSVGGTQARFGLIVRF